MANATIIPPGSPITNTGLALHPSWWRFFYSLNQGVNAAAEGTVTTAPSSGLQGGGSVAGGISLSIANNGVTNAMLRQSVAMSVMGRAFGSPGNVADITADANNRVLSREANQLAFRSFINGVSIGPDTAAPLVRYDALETTATPAASSATVTHSIPIETAAGTRYILLSTTP